MKGEGSYELQRLGGVMLERLDTNNSIYIFEEGGYLSQQKLNPI